MLTELVAKTARSISYTAVSQLVTLALTIITVTVLARILSPEDFGIVGIAMVFLTLFTSIQDFGVLPAVVQRDTRIDESISTGLFMRLVMAAIIGLAVVLLSPAISSFYGDSNLSLVLIVMSLNLLVLSLGFPAQTILTRSLRFFQLAVAAVAQYSALCVVSIVLALAGFSYWSLVIGSIAGSTALVVTLVHYERHSLRPKFDRLLSRELLEFGKHLLVTGLMSFVIFSIDQLVIGKVLGVASLGFYFVAVRFGRSIGEQITGTVNRVLFPTMARLKNSIEYLRIGYTQSLRMISIVAFPLGLGMSALSPVFVDVVLGREWSSVVVPLSILSFQGVLNALIPPAANVLIAMGKPRYMSIQSVTQAILISVSVYPVTRDFGIPGVCVLTTTLSLGVLVYFLFILSSILESRLLDIVRPIIPPLAGGIIMYAILVLLVGVFPSSVVALIVLVSSGIMVYVLCVHYISGGKDIRNFVSIVRMSIHPDNDTN